MGLRLLVALSRARTFARDTGLLYLLARLAPSQPTRFVLATYMGIDSVGALMTSSFIYCLDGRPQGKWARRWHWIGLYVLLPSSALCIKYATCAVFATAFLAFAEPYSKADTCYAFMNLPPVLDLTDPLVLVKSQVCAVRHDMKGSQTFRFIYRE